MDNLIADRREADRIYDKVWNERTTDEQRFLDRWRVQQATTKPTTEQLLARISELESALGDLYNAVDSCVDLTPEVMLKARQALQGTNPQPIAENVSQGEQIAEKATIDPLRERDLMESMTTKRSEFPSDDESILNDLDTLLEEVAERR